MRALLPLLVLFGGPALAEGSYLQSQATTECSGLEAAVYYGLVDGSRESSVTTLTDLMGVGDAPACLDELRSYNLGDGLAKPECEAAMDYIADHGAHEINDREPSEVVRRVLKGNDVPLCVDITSGE